MFRENYSTNYLIHEKTMKEAKQQRKLFLYRLVISIFTVFLSFGALSAQDKTVSGVVKDVTGETIIGASVMVKGTKVATITNIDGAYKLNVPAKGKTLLISYVGMEKQEVAITGNVVNVTLKNDDKTLDEVVVIGYGTVRKKDLTGTVGSVSGDVLRNTPVTSAAEAITGRIAGVQVTTTEGSPDAEIKIRVRGGGSISQDNSPLYIVDGFPVNSISDIAPSDIQTIDVMKDASTTAIYGARGANGVIQITTKSGKEGKISVSLNSYFGVKKVTKLLDVLSPYEYVMYQYELDPGSSTTFNNYYGVYNDLDIYKSIKGTNWQKEMFGRNAVQKNYNLSVNGGSKATRFSLGLTRSDEESIMLGSGYERNNINFKLNTEISKNFSLDFNTRLAYTIIDGAGVSSGSGATTRLRNAVKYAPTKGLREFSSALDDDESTNNPESASLLYNPIQSTNDEYKKEIRFVNSYSAALNWDLAKGLRFRSEWGYDFITNRTDNVWGPATSNAKNYAGQPIGLIYNASGYTWRNANTLSYNKKNFIQGHNLNLMIGEESTSSFLKSTTLESRFFPADMTAQNVLAMMTLSNYPQKDISKIGAANNMLSFFGRANYSIEDKYLMTFTLRSDGSSKFAAGNRWGYFPSAAVAWRITEEDFMKSETDWLSNMKLRGSIGTAGNNRISDGLWKQSFSTTGDKAYYTGETEDSYLISSSTLYNPKLKWETTFTRNVGLDYGFFKNRINGAVELYWNSTTDLLLQAPLATGSGYSFQYQNLGETSNKGVEFNIDAVLIEKKDFSLTASFNIGFNKNRVEKFQNGDVNFKTYSSGWNGTAAPTDDYIVRQGEPLGQMYGYETDGMYSFDDFTFDTTTKKWKIAAGVPDNSAITSAGNYFGPGALKFKDISGPDGIPDGKIDENDKTVIGNANPIHTGGFNITAKLKGFDFSSFFNWSYGNKVYNANKIDNSAYLLTRKYQNLSSEMSLANRFTTIDPATGNNIYNGTNANPELLKQINANATIWHPIMTTTPLHSWAIEDGSFLRINNVTLGYSIPTKTMKKLGMTSLRVYVTAYNLYTFTKYSGFDPEVDTRRSTPLTPGVDYSAYPKSISMVGGFNITF